MLQKSLKKSHWVIVYLQFVFSLLFIAFRSVPIAFWSVLRKLFMNFSQLYYVNKNGFELRKIYEQFSWYWLKSNWYWPKSNKKQWKNKMQINVTRFARSQFWWFSHIVGLAFVLNCLLILDKQNFVSLSFSFVLQTVFKKSCFCFLSFQLNAFLF